MTSLSSDDRQRIRTAVEQAEQATSAEFVTVIARRADSYPFFPLILSTVVVFTASVVAMLVWPDLEASQLVVGQLTAYGLLSLILRWPPLLMRFIPAGIRRGRARAKAHLTYVDLGLATAPDRNGILFFVALGERYVEVIADQGVARHIDDTIWEGIVADFVAAVKRGAVVDGFVAAIEACGAQLRENLPAMANEENRFDDHLIEL